MTAAARMPEPVADSQLSVYMAASRVGLLATGGIFCTTLCSAGHSYLKTDRLSSSFFHSGMPHRNTSTDRISQGSQAFSTAERGCAWTHPPGGGAWPPVVPPPLVLAEAPAPAPAPA